MISTLISILIGAAVVAVFISWALGSRRHREDASDDPVTLLATAIAVRPQEFAEILFSEQDWQFVRESAPLAVRKVFLRDRQQLALRWIEELCGRAALILSCHRQAARSASELQIAQEMRIVASYLGLRLSCGAVVIMLHLSGPFGARRLIARVLSEAESVWSAGEKLVRTLGIPIDARVVPIED